MKYPKDIAGMKFGRLTAIKKVGTKPDDAPLTVQNIGSIAIRMGHIIGSRPDGLISEKKNIYCICISRWMTI